MLTNQRMGYLYKSEIKKLLILSKIVCVQQKGFARPCARVPFCVGHHVLLGPTGEAFVAFVAHIWPSYSHIKFCNIFSISNSHNDKMSRKQKKWPEIFLSYLFLRINKIFNGNNLGIVLWPKVVKQYFHLKTCCLVNN